MSGYDSAMHTGHKIGAIVLAVSVILCVVVFEIFTQRDFDAANTQASSTMTFLQSITQRYDLFAESSNIKSYRNILEKNRLLQNYIAPDMIVDDKALARIAYEQYMTGILVLDEDGSIVAKSSPEAGQLLEMLWAKPGLKDIAQYPQKSYLGTLYYQGKRYGVAVSARTDAKGYLASFKEYNTESYANLALGDLLDGYNFPLEGAAVIVQGGRVIFQSRSYPESLTSAGGETLLQQLKNNQAAVDTMQELETTQGSWYGRTAYYKNYKFHLFFPKKAVYENRFETMLAAIAVISLLILILALLMSIWQQKKARQMMEEAYLADKPHDDKKQELVRVLLVEDNKLSMEIAEFILQGQGLHVLRAFNGEEAVNIFKASRAGDIALIFMDLHMPVLDGFEATRQIRHMERPDSDVPVIALTAANIASVKDKMTEAGLDGYISKPLNVAKMQEAIEKYAGIKAQSAHK